VNFDRLRRGLSLFFTPSPQQSASGEPTVDVQELDVLRALANDPQKIVPLAVSLGAAVVAAVAVSAVFSHQGEAPLASAADLSGAVGHVSSRGGVGASVGSIGRGVAGAVLDGAAVAVVALIGRGPPTA
jgi:hypothetical protein